MLTIEAIIAQLADISHVQRRFLIDFFSVLLTFGGRATWTNLSRYSQFSERTMRRQSVQDFDFASFNAHLSKTKGREIKIIAIDATTIKKTGKHTYGIGKFWSSCDGQAVNGIEYSCVALIDPNHPGALHLSAAQTPPKGNRVDFYIRQIQQLKPHFPSSAKHIVADGYYAKIKYCQAVKNLGLDLLTKLRKDARLYLPPPPKTGKKGRPKTKGDRILPQNLENSVALSCGATLKYQVVYVETFKCLCLVVAVFEGEHLLMNLVNTDTSMKPEEVLHFYQSRFQQELLFRDAKQQTGLGECQSRDEKRLNFHANAALTAVNLARIETHTDKPFSLYSQKRENLNRFIAQKIFRHFKISTDLLENPDFIRKILKIGCIQL